MPEYIERDFILPNGVFYANADNPEKSIDELLERINSAPAVDIVLCKVCKYYEANSCFNRQWDLESSTEIPLVREIDFCSYGERKGEGE